MSYSLPSAATSIIISFLPHPKNQYQWTVNNFQSCILCSNQSIRWLIKLITGQITTSTVKNSIQGTKNTNFIDIDIVRSKSRKSDYRMLTKWFGSYIHQQRTILFRRNGSVRVDALCQSCERHPGGGLLRAQHQYNASRCISPSDSCFTVSSRSVGLLF
jgi:hypothetical protein